MRKFLFILTLLLLAATTVLLLVTEGAPKRNSETAGTGEPLVGGSFMLTNQDGKPTSDAAFNGKLMVVFFGFTSCPDVCPAASQMITQSMEELGSKASQVVPVLITIDPETDTPAQLKSFLEPYDKRFVGLTGTPEQIEKVAHDYKAYFAKSAGADTDSFDHSAFIYIMGRDGKYLRHMPSSATPGELASAIEPYLN